MLLYQKRANGVNLDEIRYVWLNIDGGIVPSLSGREAQLWRQLLQHIILCRKISLKGIYSSLVYKILYTTVLKSKWSSPFILLKKKHTRWIEFKNNTFFQCYIFRSLTFQFFHIFVVKVTLRIGGKVSTVV